MLGSQQLRTTRYIVGCISCSCCDRSAHRPHLARSRSRICVRNNAGQFHMVLGAKQVRTACQRQLHSQGNAAESGSFIPCWTVTTGGCRRHACLLSFFHYIWHVVLGAECIRPIGRRQHNNAKKRRSGMAERCSHEAHRNRPIGTTHCRWRHCL